MKPLLLIGLCVVLCAASTIPARAQNRPAFDPQNPTVHDPVVAQQGDTYYLFCTGMGISVLTSKDLKTWERQEPVFAQHPAWINDYLPEFRGHIWAPDVIYHQGRYHLFYSCSAFAKNTSVIGHASSPTLNPSDPAYRWEDHGPIVQSVPNRDMWNAIDANIVLDRDNTPWLNFGSFWDGIKMFRMTDDLSAKAQPEEWYSLSRRERSFELDDKNPGNGAVEAPFIFRHGDYFYLLVSFDYCCRGLDSDYKIIVGRSDDVTGPYFDREGRSMATGGGSILMQGDERYAGVGHCAVYTFDGTDYLFAHGYSKADNGASKLVVRQLAWDEEDWPVVLE